MVIDPAQARSTPAWLLMPYGNPSACWGCGLEADVVKPASFRHPVFGPNPNLCTYCVELRDVVR